MPLARFRTSPVQRWRWRALVLMSVALSAVLTTALWAAHLHAPPTHAAGSLSFAPHVDYPTGGAPGFIAKTSVAVGDFNGDGKADLATTNDGNPGVSVLLGSGGGSFGQATSYPVAPQPASVAVSDLDGDGKLDLAVANAVGVSVLLGSGSGSFAPPVTYPVLDPLLGAPRAVVAGDFTLDGKPDLVTADGMAGTVTVLPNLGVGGFGAPIPYFAGGSNVTSVAIGDFNTDGLPDLAASDASSNTVYLLLATPTGVFSAPLPFPVGVFPHALAAGDLNGDGRSDLAVAESGGVSLLLTDATTNSLVPVPGFPMGSPTSVAISDFDGDGQPDVVAADGDSNAVFVALNAGMGQLFPPPIFPVGFFPGAVAAGDLNGDGKPDIVTSNSMSSDVSVLLNTTTSGAPTPTPTPIPTGGSGDTTVTLTLSGGELSATTNSAPTLSATLTGQDQTLTYTLPIRVTDATASGAGWNLTLASTQFTTAGPTPHTLPADASRVSGATSACAPNVACVAPLNNVTYPLGVPAGNNQPAVKLFNAAANSGLGAFTITPTVSVFIPAGTIAGTYTCTLTLAIVSGP